ncbi:hypothetical protein [Mastigocoleus testarum]|uniref:Uncharacterized protein n=1 Tax=Mastigocoleus testarum BC008 TaxID=371196 RepID=A0A0V7ZG98_9CYAN|nr:hypothetical protein [Mastigocoleus testarum]KST63499.1 hypothetical protein BC008_13630 [Mastigocoleus testarum BC008]
MNISGPWSYSEACKIIKKFRSEGLEANITCGGISIDSVDREAIKAVMKKHSLGNVSLTHGLTLMQEVTIPNNQLLSVLENLNERD